MANSNEGSRIAKSHQQDLPNLLLSTTYALNKSNSKRATAGLEYDTHGGLYKPVLKLGGAGSPQKYVTLDQSDWESFCEHMGSMNAFMQDSYSFCHDYGSPAKVFMKNHDIQFTEVYNDKAICLDERPSTSAETIPVVEVKPYVPSESSDNAVQQPPTKKRKIENPPCVAMQRPTFEGLQKMCECITERFKFLETCATFVNRVVDSIHLLIKETLMKEDSATAKDILIDGEKFKKFYAIRKDTILDNTLGTNQFFGANDEILKLFLCEFYAFCLPFLARDIYEELYKK